MNPTVCHISTVHPLSDNRIFHKECKSLAQAGFDVSLVITHDKHETIDGVHVIPLKKRKGRLWRMTLGTWQALRLALKQKAKVYHFHDPELIPAGIVLKLLGKKVIYDVHENTAKQILSKEYLGGKLKRRIVSMAVNGIEKMSKLCFDIIIVVTPDIAQHWNSPKVHIIINAAVLINIDTAPIIEVQKNKPVVIYAGAITSIRGIKEVIEAIGLLDDKAELWLLGEWVSEDFKRRCEMLEGWKHTKYFGYRSIKEVYGYMKNSDIAIVTFLPVPNHVTAFPNKPLEYMACRLPVVMSDFDFWKTSYESNAIFVNPKSSVDIKIAIEQLLDNRELREEMGRKGREFVEDNFSWEGESQKLIAIYNKLLSVPKTESFKLQ